MVTKGSVLDPLAPLLWTEGKKEHGDSIYKNRHSHVSQEAGRERERNATDPM
jgi:hypothetical protein